jgi:hypothetical protein
MATRVSWPFEEMIISLFMEEAPAMRGRRRAASVRVNAGAPGHPSGQPAREHRQEQQRHRDYVSS